MLYFLKRNFLTLILSSLLCVICYYLLWGLNKGFDLTDEGFYMVSYSEPDKVLPIWRYEILLQPFIGWMDLGVIGYRTLRLIMTIAASVFFASGFHKWMLCNNWFQKNGGTGQAGIIIWIIIGSLLSYSLFPATLSYNSLTLINLLFTTGAFFFFITTSKQSSGWKPSLWLSVVGIALCLQLFTKFTTGGVFTIFILFILSLIRANQDANVMRLIKDVGFISLGIITCLIYSNSAGGSVVLWFNEFREALEAMESYGIDRIVATYGKSLNDAFQAAVWTKLEIPIALFIVIKLREKIKKKIFLLGITAIFLYILYQVKVENWFSSGTKGMFNAFNVYLLFLVLLVTFVVAYFNKRHWNVFDLHPDTREVIIIFITLLFIPFIGSFGTNNSLTLQSIQYLFAWFALYLFFFHFLSRRLNNKWVPQILFISIALVATVQTINGYVHNPYRLNGSLMEQNEELLDIARLKGLKLHPTTASYISKTNELLATQSTFQENDPIISINGTPGIVYALGGKTPGPAWYKYHNSNRNCYNIHQASGDLSRLVIIAYGDGKLPNDFIACLNEKEVNFPAGYIKLGEVPHYLYGSTTSIMVPRQMVN